MNRADQIQELRRIHWNTVAARWHHWGPPLRPGEQDLRVMRRAVAEQSQSLKGRGLTVVLLGVTPEIAAMTWPRNTRLLAMDLSQAMIQIVWPGNVPGHRTAVCANWLHAPIRTASCQMVIGDGCSCLMDYPEQYHVFSKAAHGWLEPGGLLVMRCFVQPNRRETPDEVLAALRGGTIGNFHVFKFRLAMAIQYENLASRVRLGDIWRKWAEAKIAPRNLARRTGWPVEAIETIDVYQGKEARMSFPSRDQIVNALSAGFELMATDVPTYEMGDRCPTLTLRRRS